MKKKILILGIDGGDLKIFEKMKMRFLEVLSKDGVFGETCNATWDDRGWATLFTGKDASWHGGYYYIPKQNSYNVITSFSTKDYRATPIWKTISDAGYVQGYLGVPTTYPPQKIKGFFLSGGGGGESRNMEECIFPTNFIKENNDVFNGYIFDCRYQAYREYPPERLVDDLIKATKIRTSVVEKLIEKYNPNLFATAFIGPDRLQHWFWPIVNDEHSWRDSKLWEYIKQYYEVLDEAIIKLLERYSIEYNIFIVSDHGFSKYTHDININKLLVDMGLAKKEDKSCKSNCISIIKRTTPSFLKKNLKRSLKIKDVGINVSGLKWSETYAFSNKAKGIFINTKNRYPNGIVSNNDFESIRKDIISSLKMVHDPISDSPLFLKVRPKESVYSGPLSFLAPDIIVETMDSYGFSNSINSNRVIEEYPEMFLFNKRLPKTISGKHGLWGFFGAVGPDICSDYKKRLKASNMFLVPILKFLLELDDKPNNVVSEILR